jgi:hypothetical protein
LHLTKFDEDKRTKHKRIYKEHNNTPSLKKERKKHTCIYKWTLKNPTTSPFNLNTPPHSPWSMADQKNKKKKNNWTPPLMEMHKTKSWMNLLVSLQQHSHHQVQALNQAFEKIKIDIRHCSTPHNNILTPKKSTNISSNKLQNSHT